MRGLMCLSLVVVAFAGCAEETPGEAADGDSDFDDVPVTVTDDTGAIRGVVVNDAIVPIAGAAVSFTVAPGDERTTKSDAEGRFAFSEVPPGTYFLEATKVVHESAQASVTVVAGVEQPPIVKVQLTRQFTQDPYLETQQYFGFVGCAYNFGISSTCVNDYTRIAPVCGNGCAPQVTGIVDQREYRSEVGPGWQSIIWEMAWDSSVSGTAEEMQITVSFAERIGASHWYTSTSMGQPYRLQCDVGVVCAEQQSGENGEDKISPDGQDNLWNMISAGDTNIALQQDIEVFQTNFYYAPAPGDWSFIGGSPTPF